MRELTKGTRTFPLSLHYVAVRSPASLFHLFSASAAQIEHGRWQTQPIGELLMQREAKPWSEAPVDNSQFGANPFSRTRGHSNHRS